MAELPEIYKISRQMNEILYGKIVNALELKQEKCSNVSEKQFTSKIIGAKIISVCNKGKWMVINLGNNENILISLGMGGDVLYFSNLDKASEKYQIKLIFDDRSGFTIRFWWFGKFLLVSNKDLQNEPSTKSIAMDPFDKDFTFDYFTSLFKGKKGQIKAFLMNQSNVGGIGNMYMHDILFKSGLHPQKKISDMKEQDYKKLYNSISEVMQTSLDKGAFAYENDFLGRKGGFTADNFFVGYKENRPCPVCNTNIQLIKTGSTSSYICPECQKIQ